MAVAFDAKTAAVTTLTSGTSLTITNHTVGASLSNGAIAIVAEWAVSSFPTGFTVTRDGVTATLIPGTQASSGSGICGAAYAILNPSAGNKNIVIGTWSGSLECHAVAISFSGVDQTSVAVGFPHGTINAKTVATANPCTITITSATGNMVVAGHSEDASVTGVLSDNSIAKDDAGPAHAVGFNYGSGAATKTLTMAFSGTSPWSSWGFDVQASGGAAGISNKLIQVKQSIIRASYI